MGDPGVVGRPVSRRLSAAFTRDDPWRWRSTWNAASLRSQLTACVAAIYRSEGRPLWGAEPRAHRMYA